jgi:hypothetical protein
MALEAVRERKMPCGVALDQALHDYRRHNLAGNAGLHPIGDPLLWWRSGRLRTLPRYAALSLMPSPTFAHSSGNSHA